MTRQRVAFFDRLENSADNLVVRLSTDPDAISALIGDNIGVLGTVAVAMLSTVVMALAVGWKLGLVVLFGGLPFIFGAGVVREKMESSFEEKAGKIFAESVAYAGECLQAVRTVSALNMELLVEARFSQLLGEHQSQVVRSALYSMIWFALSESVDFLCMALAFW
jgi:ATP-binding cassette subfamily B (MDR/TAP) protein 1